MPKYVIEFFSDETYVVELEAENEEEAEEKAIEIHNNGESELVDGVTNWQITKA